MSPLSSRIARRGPSLALTGLIFCLSPLAASAQSQGEDAAKPQPDPNAPPIQLMARGKVGDTVAYKTQEQGAQEINIGASDRQLGYEQNQTYTGTRRVTGTGARGKC